MGQANEMHIIKDPMFCGTEPFKLDVPGLVMANIYQKKGGDSRWKGRFGVIVQILRRPSISHPLEAPTMPPS